MAEKREPKNKPKGKKKTWAAPRVKSGQLFEANSLACGKSTSSQEGSSQCEEAGFTQS